MVGVDFLRGLVMRAPGIAATKDFYESNWGLRETASSDGVVYLRGSGPEQFVYGLRDDNVFGVDCIFFGMTDRARTDALHARLAEAGAPGLTAPAPLTTPGGGYGFTLLDPDGRRLCISADVARHADTSDETGRPRKASHVVLNTPDMEGTTAFYQDRLGFRISDFSAAQMVFLRCSSDHHAIALNRSPYPSVNHVAFEMPSIDSFMRGIGRMRVAGQAPAWGPGRHGPGNNPFAYFVSPSGFVIEFTSEVQQIDEATHQPQVWSRDNPNSMDQWMTAGPPTPAMRAVMQGRPDPGFGP